MIIKKIEYYISKYWFIFFLIIVASHIYLLYHMVFNPYPELFIYPYLTNRGLVPYKQIFDQHFPGLMFFPFNLNNLGMATVYAARYWHLALVVVTQILLFLVAKKTLKTYTYALIVNALFFIFQPYLEGYVLWIETFITPLILLAFYLLYDNQKEINLFFGGFILGIILLFKQPAIILAILIYVYLLVINKSFKKSIYYLIGFIVPIILLIIYITRLSIWSDFIYWTVTFNTTVFNQMGRKTITINQLIIILPIIIVPFVYLFYDSVNKKSKNLYFLVMFIVGSILYAYARFDYIHLQPVLPFSLIAFTFMLKGLKKYYLIICSLFLVLFYLRVFVPFYKLSLNYNVQFFDESERRLTETVENYTNPGDTVFSMGTTPHIYYLTNTLPPGKVFVFQFPWFMKVAWPKILEGLRKDPPKVVIRDSYAQVQGMRLLDYFGDINGYIEDRYKVVDNISGTEILLPK